MNSRQRNRNAINNPGQRGGRQERPQNLGIRNDDQSEYGGYSGGGQFGQSGGYAGGQFDRQGGYGGDQYRRQAGQFGGQGGFGMSRDFNYSEGQRQGGRSGGGGQMGSRDWQRNNLGLGRGRQGEHGMGGYEGRNFDNTQGGFEHRSRDYDYDGMNVYQPNDQHLWANDGWDQRGNQYEPTRDYDRGGVRGFGMDTYNTRSSDDGFGYASQGQRQNERGPFYGTGPKGYKRSDERIREEVCDAISRFGHVDAREVEVIVENGEVRLTGTVNDRSAKRELENLIEGIHGVDDVRNEIKVSRETSQATASKRTDADKRGENEKRTETHRNRFS